MKYNVQNLAFLSAVITFASCQDHKKATIDASGNELIEVRKPTEDTLDKAATPPAEIKTVTGAVKSINNGKDGYTAKLETADKQIIAVTISRSNLKDPMQYKSVKEGETLKVSGDFWKMGDEDQLTVREIW